LPTGEALKPVEPQQRGRDRGAGHYGKRQRHKEPPDDAGTVAVREPISEEQHETREEAGLGDAEQEAKDEEAVGASAESRGARQDAPGNHDARDPEARAEFLHDEVAGDFEQAIAPEEGARGEAKHRGGEPKVLVHGERGEAHIDTVYKAEEVGHNRERQQTQVDLAHGRLFERADHRFPPWGSTRFAGTAISTIKLQSGLALLSGD
jgi:hypothetical protein